MFHLDSKVDKKTGKPSWNTARGDTAEILGWCAGDRAMQIRLHSYETSENQPLFATSNEKISCKSVKLVVHNDLSMNCCCYLLQCVQFLLCFPVYAAA